VTVGELIRDLETYDRDVPVAVDLTDTVRFDRELPRSIEHSYRAGTKAGATVVLSVGEPV